MYRGLNELSQQFLEQDYLLPGQTVDERVDIICNTAEKELGIKGFAKQFKDNIEKGWYSLSTPIWANYGTKRGFPISCYGSYISDDMSSILTTLAEVGMQTKYGGGTSAYFGDLRPRGSKIKDNGESSGPVHFAQLFDTLINVISQGKLRRGNFAAYLPMEHPDILEFLSIRKEGNPIQDISFGVCVKDKWLEEMIDGDGEKRIKWARVLESRINTGYPYIFFHDNVNRTNQIYRKNGMTINASNLCSEICLISDEDNSFVCDLSSMNILYYNEWKDTNAVQLLVFFLDAVISEFIDKTVGIPFLEKARYFAKIQRALGIGWLGYHSFLQSKMIPFESLKAKAINKEIAINIYQNVHIASKELFQKYGTSPLLLPFERRNATLTAIAPTKSSSFILGQVSEGIEPYKTNYYIRDLQKGKFTVKNPYLEKLLEEKKKNTKSTWNSILKNFGSVQHLEFLSDEEKDVFKTFAEISPKEIILQAAQRQEYIDQSQSLNLMIHPSTSVKDLNELILEAWRMGVKTLYYQYSMNAAQNVSRDLLQCSNCES